MWGTGISKYKNRSFGPIVENRNESVAWSMENYIEQIFYINAEYTWIASACVELSPVKEQGLTPLSSLVPSRKNVSFKVLKFS